MGGLFSSGPSAGDIRRAEERAAEKERERLRKVTMTSARRESAETMQGNGLASVSDITLGDDISEDATGLEQVEGSPIPEKTVNRFDKPDLDLDTNQGGGGGATFGRGKNRNVNRF